MSSASDVKEEEDEFSSGWFSWLLGLMDRAYGPQSYVKKLALPFLRHWTHGWGDLSLAPRIYEEVRNMSTHHEAGPEFFAATVSIRKKGRGVFSGRFQSPLHAVLPDETSTVPFRAIFPREKPWAIVVICAGTADEGYIYRQKTLAEPLVAQGVACLLPIMPFYGPRRRKGQRMFFLNTFVDLMLQCYAGCCENAVLLDWACVNYPDALLGVAGLSHGAGAAVATARYVHHDLAVIPLLVPTSPAVLATGSLENDLALDALGANRRPGSPTWEEVRSIVVDTLESAIGPDAGGEIVVPERGRFTRCVVAAAGKDDGFVLPDWAKTAVERARESMDADAELHWVPGGHVSGFLAARWLFVKFILKGFRRLDAIRKTSAQPMSRL